MLGLNNAKVFKINNYIQNMHASTAVMSPLLK
jgi:hypothetical protein